MGSCLAKKDNPYKHYCPIIHFEAILKKIIEGFKSQNLINTDLIFSMLEGQYPGYLRGDQRRSGEYKIRMTLGIF